MKEFEEKLVKRAIIEIRNETIGGIDNCFMDYKKEEAIDILGGQPTKESIINTIYGDLTSRKFVILDCGLVVEAKHIRFLGKEKIMEMISKAVERNLAEYQYDWLLG